MKWREMTVLCDKGMPNKLKSKIYRTVVRPVLMYGAEWLDNKEERKGLNAKNRDADAAMNSGGFQEG